MGCGSSTETLGPNKLPYGETNGIVSQNRRQEAQVEQIELTESVVEQYIQLEKDIHILEKKNVTKKYEDKILYADEIKKKLDQYEAMYKELKKQTEKVKKDVENIEEPSVRAFLKQQGTYQQKLDREQRAYLDSLNRQEVAQKELQGLRLQHERALKIADVYKKRTDKLYELYDKEDKLLAGIFGGKYGSVLESTLETQLDEALEWQQRVALAKFKWTNGRVLVVHACAQMAFGIKRWRELDHVELSNTRMRYFAAADARNNFVAAGQNIQSCRVYLGTVKFPYCTEQQMEQLEKAINSAFTDTQSQDRYKKTSKVYEDIHRQAASLIQWFDQVLNDTILTDLEQANREVADIQRELRAERLKLIREKVKEHLGHDINIDYDDIKIEDDDDDKELMALEAEAVHDESDLPGEKLNSLLSVNQSNGRTLSPLPAADLAPAPSNQALFGNIDDLKKQHERHRQELERQRDLAKARMDQGLQAKLEQRRTRRERMNAQKLDNGLGNEPGHMSPV